MLVIGYCMGIRWERRLCEEVHVNLACRWFCRLGLEGDVPDHSTSKNRHGRLRDRYRSRVRRRQEPVAAVEPVRSKTCRWSMTCARCSMPRCAVCRPSPTWPGRVAMAEALAGAVEHEHLREWHGGPTTPTTSMNASPAAPSPPSPSAAMPANSPTRKAALNNRAAYRPRLRCTAAS